MSNSLPSHVEGLLAFLSNPDEKANEDLALGYFRKIFGADFTRQKDAKRADGYVPGHFVLELKGKTSDWLGGLFQALAYGRDLSFSQIVVAAKNFIAVWRVDELPDDIRDEILLAKGSASSLGNSFARKYARKKTELLQLAVWRSGVEFSGSLFKSKPSLITEKLKALELTIKEGKKVRQRITLANFTSVLSEMTSFFDPSQPIKAVRAFYSMLYAWNETSTVTLSVKANDKAAIGGELITHLDPANRLRFKDFVEARTIALRQNDSHDDFFARYDEALDAVDKGFRVKHGIFFTDVDLSKFVMWLVKQDIPGLGKEYLVIDPACGSGNLVTNWRSPLELRHKVVSEIEPELLFAVERRMKDDQWHKGRFTVVPRISENKGLNFLDKSADAYLEELDRYLREKGHRPDKPLAFLCNPPYRSDEDQTTETVPYRVHETITTVTGADAANERYCCFLAQMKLICDRAKSTGRPGESLLLIFTKSAWLTRRAIFQPLRTQMLTEFEDVAGILVDSSEFFDVKGKWPVAFTIWRYKGKDANLNPHRSVQLLDLTWLKKKDLASVPWDDASEMERACRKLLNSPKARSVSVGDDRRSIREWSGQTMRDFKRARRKAELDLRVVGGLPLRDRRQSNKKAYGESTGNFIGFMDDLTPCRVKAAQPGKPWFRLNSQFMDVKKNRCFSGPPTHWGYCATDLQSAEKLFFWFSLARTFIQFPYPMWADAEDMWEPIIPEEIRSHILHLSFAIGYAENECIDAHFPANNPIKGSAEIFVSNPMSPLVKDSFWLTVMRPQLNESTSEVAAALIKSVDILYESWSRLFKNVAELPISPRTYSLDNSGLTMGSGLPQIKDFAYENRTDELSERIREVQQNLRFAKAEYFELLTSKEGVNYFGPQKKPAHGVNLVLQKTKFQRVLAKRLSVASLLINSLNRDPHFGRTKLAKLFYLADIHGELSLDAEYHREAAGPLDPRVLYHEAIGIESLGRKYNLFFPRATTGQMVRYETGPELSSWVKRADGVLGKGAVVVSELAAKFGDLNTAQSEIVATLYACWNDFLIRKRNPADSEIIYEFLHHWHQKKGRFSIKRLENALSWMRSNRIVPRGQGRLTTAKPG
jgi:hypothetical protein